MTRLSCVLAVLSIAAALRIGLGIGARGLGPPTPIRAPLAGFPPEGLGPRWASEDVASAEGVLRVAKVADHLQRFYTDGERAFWFYVGYVDRYDPAAIHHPGICFPASGLKRVEDRTVEIPCPECPMPLSFRETLWERPLGGQVYSLSAFYFRGGFAASEQRLRRARVFGVPYFAIITLSAEVWGSLEETRDLCQEALRTGMPRLVTHFPE